MPKLPGIHHLQAVRALEKAGFRMVRQGKHSVMSDGVRFLTLPRHHPINALTMGGIVRDAGLTIEEFRALLSHVTPPNQALHRTLDSAGERGRWADRRRV
jgi:predicted RNA binding protein YcfA (HicA-like mRNA interferase family)